DNMLVYASMKKAEERVHAMLRDYGKDAVLAAGEEILRRTEEAVRMAISAWPAGTYKAERAADWDGTIDKPVWVRLALTVNPEDGQLVLDFSDSDSQVDFINVPLGQVWASVVVAVAWALPPGTPRNQGLFNCLKVITKEGSVLDPVYPATSGAQAAMLGVQVTECVQLALGQIVPQEASALWGRPLNPAYYGYRRDRIDPRTKRHRVYRIGTSHSHPSMGAIHGFDGTDGLGGTVTVGGAVIRAPVEVEEWDAPYQWLQYEFLTDSAGAGQWRGGLGTRVAYRNTTDRNSWRPLDDVVQTGNSDGERFGALGLMGGSDGPQNRMWIERKGEHVRLRTVDVQYLQPGDLIITNSGGGGGVGDPLFRDVAKVLGDVLNEYVSIDSARTIYGVVIDRGTFLVDSEATAQLRNLLRGGESRSRA
ncbi:MAG: hydantoinase B/oxoprolinase family protein, partial [Dehalococcoidia bacterium]|nr:hydantoinase B/oxoprolinase family protein [Dehalococcoidia bacterium]